MGENWKPVTGFEGLYEVSDHGNVRSLDRSVRDRWGQRLVAGGRLKPERGTQGHLRVTLSTDSKPHRKMISELVAEAFIGPRPKHPLGKRYSPICYRDNDPANNRVANLYYSTPSEKARRSARKTHCKHGHEFTPANTHYRGDRGHRGCRECWRIAARRQRAKHPRPLRGNANTRKTKCPAGHDYSAENTYVHPRTGQRTCRECNRIRSRARGGRRLCRRCVAGVPHEFTHGTLGYRRHGCKCEECRNADRQDKLDRYQANRERYLELKRAYQERNREALKARQRARRDAPNTLARRREMKARHALIPVTRRGRWTAAEEAVVLRDDITLLEMACILGRSYDTVSVKRRLLKEPPDRRAHRLACMRNWHRANRIRLGVKNPQQFAPRDRTHCPAGHPYDAANTRRDIKGHHSCRACGRERARKWRAAFVKWKQTGDEPPPT